MVSCDACLKLDGIRKTYPGVVALDGVGIDVRAGEIHTLVGENGAGKSTLVKIIAGDVRADSGSIQVFGEAVEFRAPADALARGIAVIHQELNLAPHLSAAENMFLGKYPRTKLGVVDWRAMYREAEKWLALLGVNDLDVREPVGRMSVARQQVVEIAKALMVDAKILILDEPSAVLGKRDIELLTGVLCNMRARGVGILYISHRLEEILNMADRVTVFRDGNYVGTRNVCEIDMNELVGMMIGRTDFHGFSHVRDNRTIGDVTLEVEGLTRAGVFHDIGFAVRRGEIVGLAGKVGSRRTEVARAIVGADPITSGVIRVGGKAVRVRSPKHAAGLGIGLAPEDRKSHGLLLNRSVTENISLSNAGKFARFGLIDLRRERHNADEYRSKLGIKTPSLSQQVRYLSGGNQQKVVLSKLLNSGCKVLILDEPTRGIDVGAKAEIYALTFEIAAAGTSVLVISSDVSELTRLCDRVVLMRDGRVVREFSRSNLADNPNVFDALLEGEVR
ncbi:MAG: sugar ABC transporter ATP-binding protein [Firmicutes bacterium]|nr:sugar ABC transporter ATP-binding protein [Bacillota bacterium]